MYDKEQYGWYLECRFLLVLDEVEPQVRESLVSEFREVYRALGGHPEACNSWADLCRFSDEPAATRWSAREVELHAHAGELRNGIERWAQRWNLTAEWCMAVAFATLQEGGFWGDRRKTLCEKTLFGKMRLMREQERLEQSGEAGNPEGLPVYDAAISREVYFERIRVRAAHAIQKDPVLRYGKRPQANKFIESILEHRRIVEYCERVEKLRSFTPKERRELERHLTWAVRFQVKGESQIAIATSDDVEPAAVSKAIKPLMRELGLRS